MILLQGNARSIRKPPLYGVRRHSAATTALFGGKQQLPGDSRGPKSGVALRFPPHCIKPPSDFASVHPRHRSVSAIKVRFICSCAVSVGLICRAWAADVAAASQEELANVRTFQARGVIEEVQSEGSRLLIKHQAVSNYMDVMTMPFKVK